MTQRYEVTHVPHFLGGRLVFPGRGDDSIVTLDEGVSPGRYLVPVGGAEAAGQYAAKHHGGGNYIVELVADGSRASIVFKKSDGDAKAKAEAEAVRLNAGGEIDLGGTDAAPSSAQVDPPAGDSGDLPDA